MEFKFWMGEPQFVDAAWYKDRVVADHINEPLQRERLLEALELVERLVDRDSEELSVSDWGCGNGGLLRTLLDHKPETKCWGYDMCPANVDYARSVYELDVTLVDVVAERHKPKTKAGDIIVLTEMLEHIVDPHDLLSFIVTDTHAQYVVASSPASETPDHHYEYHNWGWVGDSYPKMFERLGYAIERHFFVAGCGTQFVVARNLHANG